jgi:hypothetical protein
MENKQIALASQPFKPSELLLLFVDPEHHAACTEAYRLCEPTGRIQELYVKCEVPTEYGGGAAHIRFYWNGSDHPNMFYVPARAGAIMAFPATIRDEAPTELCARFWEVANDLITIHYRFGNVLRTLNLLNKPTVCPSLAALRYHWPCIVPILRDAKQTTLAESVEDVNSRASYANLTPELRKLVAETNQTVASHLLVEDLPTPDDPPIPYDLHANFKRS